MKLMSLSIVLGVVGLLAGAFELLPEKTVGAHCSYFANGNVKEMAAYAEFERHGPCKRWYEDGTLRAEGEYENGKLVGEWAWWDSDGSLDTDRSGYYVAGRRQR